MIQMTRPGVAIIGLDEGRHPWIVLSNPTPAGEIAVVMLSKHGRPEQSDPARCNIIRRGDYPGLNSDLCVMQRSILMRQGPLRKALENGEDELRSMRRVGPDVLDRIQQAVLDSEYTMDPVRKAIRQTVKGEA